MPSRLLSTLSTLSSLGVVLCLANGARAQGPEWFEPTEPPKASPAESKGATPPAPPEEATAEAPEADPPQAKAPAKPPAPCPPAPPAPVAKPKRAAPPPHQTVWYGWQTILADASAITLAVSSGLMEENQGAPVAAGLGVYLLGAPLIHAMNGQLGKGAGSFGLRLGAPIAGAVGGIALGVATCPPDDGLNSAPYCQIGLAALGGLAGIVTASVVDAAVLAKKEVRPARAVSIAPSVVPTRQGTTFGLAGTF
jgi:hypothetical protein